MNAANRRRVTAVHPAGDHHQVVTVEGGSRSHCTKPCADCPWRVDANGVFPAEAFCHEAGTDAGDPTRLSRIGAMA